jgi:hypothetical protein
LLEDDAEAEAVDGEGTLGEGREGVEKDGGEEDHEVLMAKRYRQTSEWPCVRFN